MEACDDGADDVLAIDRVSTEVTLTGTLTTPLAQHRPLCPLICLALASEIFRTLNQSWENASLEFVFEDGAVLLCPEPSWKGLFSVGLLPGVAGAQIHHSRC